jgi:hypothetical protein
VTFYTIDRDKGRRRDEVESWLFGLDLISDKLRDLTVTAWATSWSSSTYESLWEIPWGSVDIEYRLAAHVNEVTRIGLDLAQRATQEWGYTFDPEILVPTLILHDVDKPLLFERAGGVTRRTALAQQLAHGVIGALLLQELGFDEVIVSTVAMHSPKMPFHGVNPEAYVLHYADHFACDNALLKEGRQPLYFLQKHP